MNKTFIIVFALLLIASLSLTNEQYIQASYDEIIQQERVEGLQHYLLEQPDSQRLLIQELPILYSTQHFWIYASDLLSNPAGHLETFTHNNPLGVDIRLPGSQLISDRPGFLLEIRTQTQATCQWRFSVPGQETTYKSLSREDNTHSLSYNFGLAYRLIEGEQVPIEINCYNDNYNQTIQSTIGWSSQIQSTDTFSITQTQTQIDREHPLSIFVESEMPSTCTLTNTRTGFSDQESILQTTHIYNQLRNGLADTYTISCINAHDEIIDLGDYKGSYLYQEAFESEYQSLQPTITLISPKKTTQEDYHLIFETNIPSECRQTIEGSRRVGPLSQGLLHQAPLDLSEPVHSGEIICDAENGQTSTKEVVIELNPEIPTFSLESAAICEQELIVDLEAGHPDIRYVAIIGDQDAVLREPAAQIRHSNISSLGSQLQVYVIDSLGQESQTQTIDSLSSAAANCEYAHPQRIRLNTPSSGQTQQETFTLSIETEYSESTCNIGEQTLQAAGRIHSLANAHEYFEQGTKNTFTAVCTDPAGQVTEKEFDLYWQMPELDFTLSADPQTLTSYEQPTSTITIQANQDAYCLREPYSPRPDLKDNHTFSVALTQPESQTFSFTCENVHADTLTKNITIQEDFPSEMNIRVLSDNVSRTDLVTFQVKTNMNAQCQLIVDEHDDRMTSQNNFDHFQTVLLEEGRHPYIVTCEETLTQKDKSVTGEMFIDRTPPEIVFTGNQLTCGLDRYTIYANFTDNVATDRLELTFNEQTYQTKDFPYTIRNLNLTEGETYALRVVGYDKAGNSVEASQIVRANHRNATSCDTQAPRVDVEEHETTQGVEVTVYCRDDRACAREFEFGTAPIGVNCELDATYQFNESDDPARKHSEPILLTNSSRVCWSVSDEAGNTATGTKNIDVDILEYPAHCYNGVQDENEEGVDCGGDCPDCKEDPVVSCDNGIQDGSETDVDCGGIHCDACEVGQSCESFNDCESLVCERGQCQAPTCEDGRQNGLETGRDCGGPDCSACPEGEGCNSDADCQSGLVCSQGYCSQEPMDRIDSRTETPDTTPPEPIEESRGALPWILIILGVLMAGGGGGWMFYEKEYAHQGQAGSQVATPNYTDTRRGDVLEHAQQQRAQTDFSNSKLREQAREKRKAQRKAKREEMLGAFDSKPEKKNTPKQSQPTNTSDSEDVFKDLEDMANK